MQSRESGYADAPNAVCAREHRKTLTPKDTKYFGKEDQMKRGDRREIAIYRQTFPATKYRKCCFRYRFVHFRGRSFEVSAGTTPIFKPEPWGSGPSRWILGGARLDFFVVPLMPDVCFRPWPCGPVRKWRPHHASREDRSRRDRGSEEVNGGWMQEKQVNEDAWADIHGYIEKMEELK